MKTIRLLLALVLANMCSVQTMRAERVAPTEPIVTLTDGGEYYLYNVVNDNAVHYSAAASTSTIYPRAFNSHATKVTINTTEDGYYTIKLTDANKFFYRYSSTTIQANSSSKTLFTITEVDGGYTFQTPKSSYYNENQYMGFVSSSDYLRGDATSNIVWKILPANEESFDYIAKFRLYTYLCQADDYSYNIDKFEAIYANEASTRTEISNAADELKSALGFNSKRESPSWSEKPVFLVNTGSKDWSYSSNSLTEFYVRLTGAEDPATLKATVYVDEDATFVYTARYYYYSGKFETFLDGELYQTISDYQLIKGYQRFFVELSPGLHEIELKASRYTTGDNYAEFYLKDIGVVMSPTITVNLTQAGSLGTEVLYNVDHVKDVRKIVIKGEMNDEDWTRVNMMTNVQEIDLTDANVTSLPRINPGSFFHKLSLPKVLKYIQDGALRDTRLDEITFPSTLTNIGEYAFYGTRIKEAILPDAITSVGKYAFANNSQLKIVKWSPNATTIPERCFDGDNIINTFDMPDEVTTIGTHAFDANYCCDYQLPVSIQSIGAGAFYNARFSESLNIPGNTWIGNGAFLGCSNLKYVTIGEGATLDYWSGSYSDTFENCKSLKEIVFPTTFYTINISTTLQGCSSLKKVTLKSPTMVSGSYKASFLNGCGSNITVCVPSYLVNAYKLDSYWYNYNIEGFSTADITYWAIRNSLTFYSQDRFEGTPSVNIWATGSWVINGTIPQNIGNFITNGWSQQYNAGIGDYSKVISNCENVTINQHYRHEYYAYNDINKSPYSGRWHFLCLPFDFKISDIATNNDARFAIRYYDGASRATNGTGGNWKNYNNDDIIPAGTGFIIQANKETRFYFHSLDNDSKQNVVSNKIFVKPLEANVSEQSSNKGWNLVGNPWMCYYNIHKLNFTGAITVYDGYNKTYKAYSIIDDDYAILPNQAFFVQCPDEVSEISFPVDGRQLTSVIESQNGVKAEQPQAQTRWLIDVELSDGEQTDKTRFVMNEKASLAYETSCDASKFIENGTSCPQLYTIENGEALAINERPIGDGTIQLGMIIATDGTYTISAPRNQFQKMLLIDYETGTETDLSVSNYTFSGTAGTDNCRFELRVNSDSMVTGVQSVATQSQKTGRIYNLSGQRVSQPQKGVSIVNGKKIVVK